MNASTLPPDVQRLNAILTDFLQSNHTLVEIADFHKMTVLELLEWARQPKVKEVLDAVFTLSRQRIRTIRAEARITSLRRLDLIAASSDHEETARRAAMGLLRGSSPRRKRIAPASPSLREEAAVASSPSDASTPAMKVSLPGSAGANDIAGSSRPMPPPLDDPTSLASPVTDEGGAEHPAMRARRRGIERERGPTTPVQSAPSTNKPATEMPAVHHQSSISMTALPRASPQNGRNTQGCAPVSPVRPAAPLNIPRTPT